MGMPRQRPDLIVPVRDRRRGRRIVTLRNFGIFAASIVLLFVALTIFDNRKVGSGGDYGRLLGAQVPQQEPVTPRYDVVAEQTPKVTVDESAADPMLTAPA